MNILIDALPESVMVKDAGYPVEYGFRAFILIEMCIFDRKLTEQEKTANALNIFFKGDIPHDIPEAIETLLWFYRCGNEAENSADKPTKKTVRRCYDFEQDAAFFYAAFLTQYGIDLNQIPGNDLHWWKFKAMFDGLSEEHKLCKIMGYRSIDTAGMSKAQKKFYSDMKKQYAIDSEIKVDSKLALAKRDRMMLDYVQKRFKGVSA
ncbi:bacteriophage Gp15 family protein [Parasporobacterium paucivorans]|uniref:Bacteriophage Gp15 protein n=1 Tax=Parasporobacterium paucivorans DSM 15970 TaxID=1122934 RepID=A0A1M6B1I0_9FIRM|nr:bacteriophage Gp15 family protein [Parasporobacterium paucivorans]SHI42579.1 Bacteriophage Gp15 protein [Parasporobacterium paucivorans DSM 15970]